MFCAVCFGDPTSPLTQGYNFAVISLLIITVGVLGGFAALFLNFRKRAKALENKF